MDGIISYMDKKNTVILIVDNDDTNRLIIEDALKDEGYSIVSTLNGEEAWEKLLREESKISAILIDSSLSHLGGLKFLHKVQSDARYSNIPIILQTLLGDKVSITEGIEAGAFYYLTKPFSQKAFLAVVKNAITIFDLIQTYEEKDVNVKSQIFSALNYAELQFQTLPEARQLAQSLAEINSETHGMVLGLTELFINAIEHGNLAISYEEKTRFVNNGTWEDEIEARLSLDEYKNKWVHVQVNYSETKIVIKITDDGKGFDWEEYMEISPDRAFDLHGRGIAMSRMLSFDTLEYKSIGNEVVATKNL